MKMILNFLETGVRAIISSIILYVLTTFSPNAPFLPYFVINALMIVWIMIPLLQLLEKEKEKRMIADKEKKK